MACLGRYGVKNRAQLIQYLINKFSLKSYLEIGIQHRYTFDKINCETKIGVDPNLNLGIVHPGEFLYRTTSDEFFEQNNRIFDIVFIDGLHLCEQVIKDVINSLNVLSEGGFVVLHDCLPKCAEMCERHPVIPEWTGDVWKAVVWFRFVFPDISCCILDMDYGCGVIRKTDFKIPASIKNTVSNIVLSLDFSWLKNNLDKMNIKGEYEGFDCNS
jgi:hypothetical protein